MRNPVPADFAGRIKQLRQTHGLTQANLAERLGVSYVTVNRWENGAARPSAKAWRKIAKVEALGFASVIHAPDVPNAVHEAGPAYNTKSSTPPIMDFAADPQVVQVVAEAERLSFGHLLNPTFAAETALVDPLPHQRIAVYEQMLTQPRLRFMLADDAGAGKTIMAGLYIREMLSRRLIRRVLIVPPAGLVSNWEREMHALFSLPFRVVSGSEAHNNNPFIGPESDLLIVSVDTLAGERMFSRLQEADVEPYALVIFDEAHKLSADREPDFRVRKTERYRLAEALAGVLGEDDMRWQLGWATQHLMLLTATPHMGKDFPYYCLWRLLEPEALATFDAFNAYPPAARRHHFIRRVKEEMVRLDGSAIYPMRVSDTHSYDLVAGAVSEQRLYDETTAYIRNYYNRARFMNRSAARLAMSIFQRRLASSTYALLRSFERRLEKLECLIADIHSGKVTVAQLLAQQRKLADVHDVFDEMTGDEESAADGQEGNEVYQDQVLAGVVANSLADLEIERGEVQHLLALAKQVDGLGQESKFARLREVLQEPRFADEKVIIFTEHRDTLDFLVRRLEGLGFTGQVARIHGGMGTQPDPQTGLSERDEQVAFFKRPTADGGARFLVATDAAGEGINLQFCWLMVNYDIPWNPARLEQRMGRIHRYGQRHDPVVIINLVAGKTREGRVMKVLLEKLEAIRKELHSDKVFDVVGRLFEGVSLRAYLEDAVTDEGAEQAATQLTGKLTPEQVAALAAREQRLYGGGGDVRAELPRLQTAIDQEAYRRLLPGYVQRFIERAAPLVGLTVQAAELSETSTISPLDGAFTLQPARPGALDPFWPALESYPAEQRERFTVHPPSPANRSIFLRPGEPFFDTLCAYVSGRHSADALRGAVFTDPIAEAPYTFHLGVVTVERQADPPLPALARLEEREARLFALRQDQEGRIGPCAMEHLLLLRGGKGLPPAGIPFVAGAEARLARAEGYARVEIAGALVAAQRQALLDTLPEREDFLRRGYDYQQAELAAARARYTAKAREGDPRAKGEVTRLKGRQAAVEAHREEALAALRREPELIASGQVTWLAHALVVPSADPEERQRFDAAVEAIAVRVAWAHEVAAGAVVRDVSTPELARAAGLGDHPGFDLLSSRPGDEERAIEVKGRATSGQVEITDNEWARACTSAGKYWLYVVYDCATPHPRLARVKDPFRRLIAQAKGSMLIGVEQVLMAAEQE